MCPVVISTLEKPVPMGTIFNSIGPYLEGVSTIVPPPWLRILPCGKFSDRVSMALKNILDTVPLLLAFYFVKCKESEKSLSSDSTMV